VVTTAIRLPFDAVQLQFDTVRLPFDWESTLYDIRTAVESKSSRSRNQSISYDRALTLLIMRPARNPVDLFVYGVHSLVILLH